MTLGPRYKAVFLYECKMCCAVTATASQFAADEEATKPDSKLELQVLCFSVSHF